MIRIRNIRVGLVVLAILAAISFIAPIPRIQAQDGDDDPIPTTIEVTGPVESFVVSGTGVTGLIIGGEVFNVPTDGTIDVTGIALGDWVTIVASISEDSVYTVTELAPQTTDIDNDGILNEDDNCLFDANADQLDTDADGVGDVCQEEDDDGDEDDGEDDDEDDGDEDEGEDEDVSACEEREGHPVATALAAEFDLDYETVMGWHCEGFGFGEISRALMLADEAEGEDAQTAEDYLEMKAGGMGWGQIVKESGVNPSELAQGRVISQKNKDKDKDGDDEEDGEEDEGDVEEGEVEIQTTRPGNNGNGNGNNGNNGNGNGNNGNNGNGRGNKKK